MEKVNQKLNKFFEQTTTRKPIPPEETKLENLLKQFETLNLGEKPAHIIKRKINPFEPKSLSTKPWK